MNVKRQNSTIIAVLVAALAHRTKAQTRPNARQGLAEYRVSPISSSNDAYATNTVARRRRHPFPERRAQPPSHSNIGTGQFARQASPDGEAINAVLAELKRRTARRILHRPANGVKPPPCRDGRGGFGLATPLAGTESGATGIAAADVDADGDNRFSRSPADGTGLPHPAHGWPGASSCHAP